jgi:hypothetical protein
VAKDHARRGRLAPRRVLVGAGVLPDGGWQVVPDPAGPESDSVPARQGRAPVRGRGDVWRRATVADAEAQPTRRGFGWRDGDELC